MKQPQLSSIIQRRLLRLGHVRPVRAPKAFGLRSENAAHRIAVEWDGPDGTETGVYIPRRDTASRLNAWAGGRLFPGEHGHADFEVHETPHHIRVALETRDGDTRVDVTVAPTDELRGSELFADLAEASRFFRRGAKGFSATRAGHHMDVLEFHTAAWKVEAGRVIGASSSFFDDPDRFPPGSVALDCALVMRNVPANWRPLPAMAADRDVPLAG